METAANDVLEVTPTQSSIDNKCRLIPWVMQVVVDKVDLDLKQVIVNWDVDY